jgi:type II secretory ATPase GspE/PulE/Tfp pilus assembly ATPase PilB-like protein
MPEVLLASVQFGGYISPIKYGVFIVFVLAWILLVKWVHDDADEVATDEGLWTSVALAAGILGTLIWLVIPIFIVGMLFYIVAVGGAGLSYVIHRNSRVADYDKVLTVDHIKGLFGREEKEAGEIEGFLFITANNNEVPVPAPKTPDHFGYRAAYEILRDAVWRRASDIALSPTHDGYSLTYSVDGATVKQPPVERERAEYFIHFLKNMANLDINERRKPQRGDFSTSEHRQRTDWQLATAGSTVGEQVRIRKTSSQNVTELDKLGLTDTQFQQLSGINRIAEGLFLVSGPRKSGVTSTFYALLRNHDAFINSICTLEREPSSKLPNITQNVYSLSDTGTTTFAKKLQYVVRMGPNIVGVADCRDPETAQTCAAAAKDGKIVYVAIEADNVIQALGKWLKLVGNRAAAVDKLLGISCQRLLRKLCDECKEAYEPNRELLRKFNLPPEKAKVLYRAGRVVYDKHGKPRPCDTCQEAGYVGRMGVFETIMFNDALKKAIMQSKTLGEVNAKFRSVRMLYLQEQALRKIIEGQTAVNEMVRVFTPAEPRQKAQPPEQK